MTLGPVLGVRVAGLGCEKGHIPTPFVKYFPGNLTGK